LSRFLRALEKVGLVEVERRAEEPAYVEPAGDVPPPEPAAEAGLAATPSPAPPAASGPIQEQRPFEDIYAAASVGPSPFSAEKLLKILEGLSALEPAARRAAVTALDAADDAWTIDDALLDAERKIKALGQARAQIEQQARAALEEARVAVEAREQKQQEAVARVRQQIAELEGLLEREVTRATEEKAALHDAARAAKEACTRECTRLDAEAHRLRRLAEVFAPPPGPHRT
jgi:hypothetical protein